MKTSSAQESKFRKAYDMAGLAWWEYNLATQKYICSKELFEMYQHPTPKELLLTEKDFLSYLHPDDVDKWQAFVSNITSDNTIKCGHRIVTASGDLLFVSQFVILDRDNEGNAICISGVAQEITQQKLEDARLKQSEQKYQLLFNQSLIPKLIFHTESLRIVEVNAAALKLYGYNREEFLDLTIIDLRPPEDRPALYDAINKYKDKRQAVFSSIHRHLKKDGSLFFVQIEATLIELATGMHSLVIAHDMTEKLQLQQRLINEKVTAQKEIAKAIIQTQEQERKEIGKELHDNVNQILTTVKLYIENARIFPEHQASFIEKSVTLTQKAINEIRLLSKQLVSPVINDLNFKAAITELVEHYRWLNLFEIHYTFDVEEDHIDKDMQLTIYRIMQEQMNNIVKHAKATHVTIEIISDKVSLTVSVTDDGKGFDTTAIPNGVGIRNIKNRAEVYKGVISLNTTPGKGCSLSITFPVN